MAYSVLDALNSSGLGQNWLGGNLTGGLTNNMPAPAKQSFLGGVGHTLGEVGSAVGGMLASGVKDANALVAGTQRNLGLNSRQSSLVAHTADIQKRDMANTAAYRAGQINKAQYQKNTAALLKEYQDASSTAKGIQGDYYGAGQVAKDYAGAAGTVLALAAPEAEAGAGALVGVRGAQAAAKVLDSGLGAGESLGAKLPTVAKVPTTIAGKVVRGALVGTPTAQAAVAVPTDLAKGNVAGAVGNAAVLAAPAAIGGIKALGKLAPDIANAFYGKQGFFDAVAKAGGPNMVAHLDSLPASEQASLSNTLRQIQQYNNDQFGGDTQKAATFFKEWVADRHGGDITKLTPQQLSGDLKEFADSHIQANALHTAGRLSLTPGGKPLQLRDGQSIAVGRFEQGEKSTVMDALANESSAAGRTAALDRMASTKPMWSQNPYTKALIYKAAKSDNWAGEMKKIQATKSLHINGVDQPELSAAERASGAFKEPLSSRMSNGYFPILTENGRATIKAAGDTALLDRGVKPNAVLGRVGDALTKAGLSTQATNSAEARSMLKANFASNLIKKGIEGDPKEIYRALQAVDKPGVSDARFLRSREAEAALHGITTGSPKDVIQALKDAHASLPKSVVGAGPAALNKAIASNKVLPGYIRAETAGRYDSGLLSLPFRAKTFIKGNYVSYAEGRKFGVKVSDADRQAMKDNGMLFKGHAGQDQGLASGGSGGVQGKALLPWEQEKMVTGLAASVAQAHGTTVADILKEDGALAKQLRDSVSLVHGYGTGGYLNSPMAKTLNLILFPSRFDAKVIQETGRLIGRMPAMQQVALVQGVANTASFLRSPQGQQWQKDNSELVGLIRAFTPLGTVQNLINFTTRGGHFGDLGEIGGLPVGVLGSLLEHQGANLGPVGTSQYLDPKTGQPVPDKIPTSMKARFQQGLTDIVASLFSFPGRTANLGSKTSVIQTAIPQLKPASKDISYRLKDGTTVSAPTTNASTKSIYRIPTAPPSTSSSTLKLPNIRISTAPRAPKRKIYAVRPGTRI